MRIERKIENLKKNWEGSTGFEMDHWVNQDNFNVGAKAYLLKTFTGQYFPGCFVRRTSIM